MFLPCRTNRLPYNSPLQLTLIGHVIVWFLMRYAFNDVRLGLFRNVPSSFFHTYVIAVCSYDTENEDEAYRLLIWSDKKIVYVCTYIYIYIFTYCSRSQMNTVGHRRGRYWVYPGRTGWDDACEVKPSFQWRTFATYIIINNWKWKQSYPRTEKRVEINKMTMELCY